MTQITAPQVRQARAQLGWSQRQLAQAANLAVSTIADFERGVRVPTGANLDAMQAALQKAGVDFETDGSITSSLIPLSNRPLAGGLAGSLIAATDFEQWTGIAAQGYLPRLIGSLIRASAGAAVRLCGFPWGDSVQHPGPDGECEIDEAGEIYPPEMLPPGRSIWELTTEFDPPFGQQGKATTDALKRAQSLASQERAQTSFVFVTTRRTQHRQRKNWIRDRKTIDGWRDVRVLDADALAEWVNLLPLVAAWLAGVMGKPEAGCRPLREAWQEWAETPEPKLTGEILRAGRDEAASQVHAWLWTDGNTPLFVQGETSEEVLAFLYAALSELPDATKETLLARTVVANNSEQARRLGSTLIPHVIVLNGIDPDIAHGIARKGHRVIVAMPARAGFEIANAVTLPRASRFDLQLLLENLFVNDPLDERRRKAAQFAKQCGGSIVTLRDLMTAEFRRPDWVDTAQAATLRAAMLAGGWNVESEGDREILARLADKPYEEVERDLIEWTNGPGSPLQKIGQTWKLAAPRHAYYWLAPGLTSADLGRFEPIVLGVLGEADPTLALSPVERICAPLRGNGPKYSPLMQAGLCDALALLAVLPDRVSSAEPDAPGMVARIVGKLLHDADRFRWRSQSSHLTTLAEAAPEAFLRAVEADLERGKDASVLALLEDEPEPFGRSYGAHLLWALEFLAWGKEYFPRAAAILARLTHLGPSSDTRQANRPDASLADLFAIIAPRAPLPWQFRFATLGELIKALPDLEDVFVNTLFTIVSDDQSIRMVGPFPEWRNFETGDPPDVQDWRSVPWSYIIPAVTDASGVLLEHIRNRPNRWSRAIKAFQHFPPDIRADFVSMLKNAAPGLNDDAIRGDLTAALRDLIGHHREFPDQTWTMPETDLKPLEEAHDLLQPRDPISRHLWLFAGAPLTLLHPVGSDFHANFDEAQRLRTDAVTALWQEGGKQVLRNLATREGISCGLVGYAIAKAKIPDAAKDNFFRCALLAVDERDAGMAMGLTASRSSETEDRTKRLHAWLDVAQQEAWPTHAIVRLLLLCDPKPETWALAAGWGAEVKRAYWEKQSLIVPNLSAADLNEALHEMMAVGRAAYALDLAVGLFKDKITPALLSDMLIVVVEEEQKCGKPLLQVYDVESALNFLDHSGEFADDKIAEFEFKLLSYLEYSGRRERLAIHRVMARKPSLFRDLLCLGYPAENESKDGDDDRKPSEREARIAALCYGLLRNWRTVPGLRNGVVDRVILEDWITKARALCGEAGRLRVCDATIGNMLAHAPADPEDAIWPCRAVREVLRVFGSEQIENGLVVGEMNKRGMTVRMPRDGGEQERALQARYEGWAQALRLTAPRAANVLDQIARYYATEAKREDDVVKRLDW